MSRLHVQEVLVSHANARLTCYARALLVRRVRVERRPVAHVAKELGVSRQCAHRWVARFDAGGPAALADRSSRPRRSPARTPAAVEARVLAERAASRRGPDFIAVQVGVPARTVSRHRVPHLADCDPLTGVVIRAGRHTTTRYERSRPGELVHIDVKKIGRIPDGGGWRAHGRGERPNNRRGPGYDYVHAAVDDHSRLAYAEILPDEKGATAAGFLRRTADYFAAHGIPCIERILSDNAYAYRTCREFRAAAAALGAQQRFIRPHCPWQNGKVERLNRTLQVEWAYRQVFTTNTDRTQALDPWLTFYNNERRHTALGGLPPTSRLAPT
jgi:transposase InsO family protein